MNLRNNKVEPLSGGWRVWLCGLSAVFILTLLCSTARADIVTDWNVTTNALVANDVGNNPRLRTLAMVHVAMSDAINTVQNRYTRVVATLPAAPGASAEAAAATAARQILTQIYPQQKAKIEEAYAASLKAIPDGPAKSEGIKLGMEVADAVQADRANDGTNAPRHLPPARCPRGIRADDDTRVGAICARQAVGAQERRPVPARPAAGTVERGVGPRLQRGQEPGRHQQHGAYS
jgi:hypothetical protein